MALVTVGAMAQASTKAYKDTTTFKGYLFNDEYDVYMDIDFYHNSIQVPWQEIYGELPGYFGDKHDGRKWLITDATIHEKTRIADISLINDYGSEDLVATLQCKDDSTYVLTQGKGSNIKIARKRKWVKMPKTLVFIKKSKK